MIKTRIIKVKNIENEEIILATMTKIIISLITKTIIIIMMIMRFKISNCIKM